MKTLDLNAYGVSEMNKQEMMEIDGGGWGSVGRWLIRVIRDGVAFEIIKEVCSNTDLSGLGDAQWVSIGGVK
ncbi:MAG: hypothetical protein LBH22_01895 [Bacteroidales bacterium]|jgi:hypothetical protein|nr:hypothetical protein [Bacteroidales bacterium]